MNWEQGMVSTIIQQIQSFVSYHENFVHTAVAKMIKTLVFSAAKNSFKSVSSIFCCSVSVGNISLHSQTFNLPLIVIIQWDVWDLIWSSSVCLESHEETEQTETQSRRTVSQDASRNLLQSYSILLKVLVTCVKSCKMRRAGFWHKFHDSILIHKLAIQFDSIQYWLFWISQVQYMTNFIKEKISQLNAAKYTWVRWYYITIILKVKMICRLKIHLMFL